MAALTRFGHLPWSWFWFCLGLLTSFLFFGFIHRSGRAFESLRRWDWGATLRPWSSFCRVHIRFTPCAGSRGQRSSDWFAFH